MALTIKQMALMVAFLGGLSFIFGIVAENTKPASGTPITGKGVIICKYPSDPSVPLGFVSFFFLVVCAVAGYSALFHPYKGKHVPKAAMFQNKGFSSYLVVAVGTSILAVVMLLWPTIQGLLHRTNNIHHDMETSCPTAKTAILGGGAFLSLDACLFWLVTLMLANNARSDYLDESDDKVVGSYGADEPFKADA